MIDAICAELTQRKSEWQWGKVESIYFGGGTPSLLGKQELQQIMDTILENYVVNAQAEITLEANPDDITEVDLRAWKNVGINRLSIGIQSFRENDLKWMNRAHNALESATCIQKAKDGGFSVFSVDLIYGLPSLTEEEWQNHIQTVIDYGVDHISAYCLTVEEKTLLSKQVKSGQIQLSNEDEQAKQFEQLRAILAVNGYEQYEVSNFCKPGKEARHNTAYWQNQPYFGIGPSAHSYDGVNRRFNVANNQTYIKGIVKQLCYYETEVLSPKQKFNETILTGLRTKWGVNLALLFETHVPGSYFMTKIQELAHKKWIRLTENQVVLEKEGWLMADFISAELFEMD